MESYEKKWFDVDSDMLDNLNEMAKHACFIQRGYMSTEYVEGRTPALLACLVGEQALALSWSKKGASVHAVDGSGRGVMHYACERDLKDVFQGIISRSEAWLGLRCSR